MFSFDLTILKRSNDKIIYIGIPFYFYILYIFLVTIVFSSMFFWGITIFQVILSIIFLGALTYKEKWIFDKNNNTITNIEGLLFFYHKRVFKLSDLNNIKCNKYIKGSLNSSEKKQSFFKKYFIQCNFEIINEVDIHFMTVSISKEQKLNNIIKSINSIK